MLSGQVPQDRRAVRLGTDAATLNHHASPLRFAPPLETTNQGFKLPWSECMGSFLCRWSGFLPTFCTKSNA